MGNLDLNKLEKKLDDALSKETPESMIDWIDSKRNKSTQQLANEIIETMESFGLTHDEMLEVIKLVREKLGSKTSTIITYSFKNK